VHRDVFAHYPTVAWGLGIAFFIGNYVNRGI